MSENTQVTLTQSIAEISVESEEVMGFTLQEHTEERIKFHSTMLKHYLDERGNNEKPNQR